MHTSLEQVLKSQS